MGISRNGIATLASSLALVACSSAATTISADAGCTPACGNGLTCQRGTCAPKTCGSAADCAAPLTCAQGFCTETSCTPPCDPTQVCLAQVCIPKAAQGCAKSADCPAGETCLSGFCTQTGCAPPCAGGEVCLGQVCIPTSGGACSPPYVACRGASGLYCANVLQDSSNCGACGESCPAGMVCNGAGQCAATCVASEAVCGGRCASLATDQANCGACGKACPAGQACSGGTCAATCALPYAACGLGAGAYCADERVDPSNCGACGKTCAAGESCEGGACATPCPAQFVVCGATCVDERFDPGNCGGCGVACPAGDYCRLGACTAPATTSSSSGGTTTSSTTTGSTTTSGGSGLLVTTLVVLPGTLQGLCADLLSTVDIGVGDPVLPPEILRVTAAGQVSVLNDAGAPLSLPAGIAADGLGNVYFADSAANVIRKIDASGRVSTFAGDGDAGLVNGMAVGAQFSTPVGVAIDSALNLYVSELGNQAIRVITSAGQVLTAAGGNGPGYTNGPAATAQFSDPKALALDGQGNLFIVENTPTVRKLSAGVVSTVVGLLPDGGTHYGPSSTATFAQASLQEGIAADALGNLYLTDSAGNRVLQVDPSGNVTALVGGPDAGFVDGDAGTARFNMPGGIALGPGGVLYVADDGNRAIRVITP